MANNEMKANKINEALRSEGADGEAKAIIVDGRIEYRVKETTRSGHEYWARATFRQVMMKLNGKTARSLSYEFSPQYRKLVDTRGIKI